MGVSKPEIQRGSLQTNVYYLMHDYYPADEMNKYMADLARRGLDNDFKQGLHKEGCLMPDKCTCGLHAYWADLEQIVKEGE